MDEKQKKIIKEPAENGKMKNLLEKFRNFFKRKQTEEQDETAEVQKGWVQIRLFPIWLRIILVLVLLVITALLGAIIGYSVIGDGATIELFKKETWTHITDIIRGVE